MQPTILSENSKSNWHGRMIRFEKGAIEDVRVTYLLNRVSLPAASSVLTLLSPVSVPCVLAVCQVSSVPSEAEELDRELICL